MKRSITILLTLLLAGNIYSQDDTIDLAGKWIVIESGKTPKSNMGWNFLENGTFQTIPTGNEDLDKDWVLKDNSSWLLSDSTLTLSMLFVDLALVDNEIIWKFNVRKTEDGYGLEMLYEDEQEDKLILTLKEY